MVQRQRQQRAVFWADDSQVQQSLDVGRNVAMRQQKGLGRAGGARGPGQQGRLVEIRYRQTIGSLGQHRPPTRRRLSGAFGFVDEDDPDGVGAQDIAGGFEMIGRGKD